MAGILTSKSVPDSCHFANAMTPDPPKEIHSDVTTGMHFIKVAWVHGSAIPPPDVEFAPLV